MNEMGLKRPSGYEHIQHMNRKSIKSTRFGSVGVIWAGLSDNSPKIFRILLSKPGLSAEDQVSELYPNTQACSCAKADDAGRVACAQFHYGGG